MTEDISSSHFTESGISSEPFGPPLIGALLRIPLDAVRRRMLERLHEHGFDDLDPAHLTVLQYPGPQGMRPSDLAVQLRISKQALNYLLGQLESGGYLERRPDPDDLRSKRIVLTKRGTKVAHVIREAVAEMEATWSKQLGRERFDRLRGLLLELNRLV